MSTLPGVPQTHHLAEVKDKVSFIHVGTVQLEPPALKNFSEAVHPGNTDKQLPAIGRVGVSNGFQFLREESKRPPEDAYMSIAAVQFPRVPRTRPRMRKDTATQRKPKQVVREMQLQGCVPLTPAIYGGHPLVQSAAGPTLHSQGRIRIRIQ